MTKRTLIDFADIRVGDVVERRCTYPDGSEVIVCGPVKAKFPEAVHIETMVMFIDENDGSIVNWYLIERPDPDEALIEAIARALANTYGASSNTREHIGAVDVEAARAALAAIRETHDVTPRGES